MKIKKIISIIICLIMFLNILIPTIVLAMDSNAEKENITTNESDKEETEGEDIEKTENKIDEEVADKTENKVEETTEKNENEEEDRNENIKNENKAENKVETTKTIQEGISLNSETISTMYIDTPTNGSTYYSEETKSINVTGWKMANEANTTIKAYIDNKEINASEIKYGKRPDVINAITGYGTAEQNPNPGFSFVIDTTNLSDGKHVIKIDVQGSKGILTTTSIEINYSKELHVEYRTHVQDIGWQDWREDGELAGTEKQGLRLEALNIQLANKPDEKLKIKYQVHVQDIGWQDWKEDGELAGTEKQGLRLEALKIELENTEEYSIMYRVHVQDIGWQDWKKDGEMAGTEKQGLRLEAIEIKIIEKEKKSQIYIDAPTNGSTYYSEETKSINVTGWKMANEANTTIKAYIDNKEINASEIKYSKRPDVINAITGYGTAEQNPNPGFSFGVDLTNLSDGKHMIKIDVQGSKGILTTTSIEINYSKGLHVEYRTHVQDIGWQDWKKDGEIAGTEKQGLRLEALNIQLVNKPDKKLKIKYQVHVQDIGWQDWKEDGELAGTEKQGLRLEALKIELENTEEYSIMYRVHVQDIGWQDWKKDGEIAGTEKQELRLEAIEIKIIEKEKKSQIYIDAPTNGSTYYSRETKSINVTGWKMANISNTTIKAYIDNKEISASEIKYSKRPDVINAITGYGTAEQNPNPGFSFVIDTTSLSAGNHIVKVETWYENTILTTTNTSFNIDSNIHIKYSAHVEQIGWQDYMQDGETAGTEGKGYRVEALKISLINAPDIAHIKYKANIEGTGWTDYVQDGEQLGITGQSKKIEAIQLELEGLDGYVVEYKAHVQQIGWQPWVFDGMEAGTTNQGLRIEALNIRIVKEENSIVPQVKYSAHSQTGWTSYRKNGETIGNTTNGIKLDDIKIALEKADTANVKYRVHVQDKGWLEEVQNDKQAGTSNANNGIEAIEIQLEGLDEYSIEYRTYVIGKGWQEWVYDGETSGTTGQLLQIGAIQIRLKIKTKIISSSNFYSLDESKYPGYKQALQNLQNAHPNWVIKIVYTGLDWNNVLDMQSGYSNGEPYSLTQTTGAWRDPADNNSYQGGWYKASRAAIAYMMDPRNSFDQYYVFQFQNLSKSSVETVDNVSTMTNGTFLQSYVSTIVESATNYNVSAFHLASRMLLEQGTSGWSVNGYQYMGRTVYNYANIGATGSTQEEIIANGAAYAYRNHWFTPEFCIDGTAKWIYNNYLTNGQNTKYFEKYNVVTQPYTSNQYMQNIRAANDEGKDTAESLEARGLLDYPYEFLIPVYENMPTSPSPRPAT